MGSAPTVMSLRFSVRLFTSIVNTVSLSLLATKAVLPVFGTWDRDCVPQV
jgi:hypothetical protein